MGLIGLGGGETTGKYLGINRAVFPSCWLTFGVIIADKGGGIIASSPKGLIISEKILLMSCCSTVFL